MKYYFYSQFDKGYMTRALALYGSLAKNCKQPFHYYMLCLDDASYDLLKKMNLACATLIRLTDIETDELKQLKKQRKLNEYYWTVGPNGLMYVLNTYQPHTLAYLDADMFFFSSPETIYEEFGDNAVLIMPHRLNTFTKVSEREVGKYNVGMLIFKNNKNGRTCLEWWRERCNEWCYDRIEDGKYGDQKYLDEFPERFKGVYVMNHKGTDLAPWNIGNYRISAKGERIFVDDQQLIFFHFAKLKIYYPHARFFPTGPLSNYTLPSIEKRYIYAPYIKQLYLTIKEIEKHHQPFPFGAMPRPSVFKQIKNIIGGWLLFGIQQ